MKRVLILGGTNEARELAKALDHAGVPVVSSLAGRIQDPALPVGETRLGPFGGVSGLCGYITEHGITAVVDATHPFAVGISANALSACSGMGVPMLRLVRPSWRTHPAADTWTWVEDLADACASMMRLGERPFLTTGRQGLQYFTPWREHWALARVVDEPEEPWPAWTILRRRGPFDMGSERRLMHDHQIDVLVTKDSGGSMTEAKLTVAAEMNIPVVVIKRPLELAPHQVNDVTAAVDWAQSA